MPRPSRAGTERTPAARLTDPPTDPPPAPPPRGVRRRRVLGALAAAPALVAGSRLVAAGLRAVPAVRPPGSGSSAGRCAQCGATGHTMLDPSCPAAPGVM